MKATNASGSRRSTRKAPRNTVSSPWVHKNQSNIVSHGRPKGSSKKSELKKKIYQKTATSNNAINPDIVKLKLALESPVSNGNGYTKRTSQRKKASLRLSLNERDLVKIDSGKRSSKTVAEKNEIQESETVQEIEVKKLDLDDDMEVEESKESQIINGEKDAKDNSTKSLPNDDPKKWCLIL